MFFHMSQPLATARERVFEDDVPKQCGIGGDVAEGMCQDALANVGSLGMIGMEGTE